MFVLDILFLVLVVGFILLSVSCLIHEKKASISPTPVLPWVRQKAVNLISEHYQDKHASLDIVDLGSGWGGMLLALSNAYPDSQITGYEISPWPRRISKLRTLFRKNIKIVSDDFFENNIDGFDVYFCYLSPYHMKKLAPKFDALPPGRVIVSASFAIPDREPLKTDVFNGPVKIPVYLYKT